MRIKNRKRAALALLLCFVMVGGVSAAIYSATLVNTVSLDALYPIELRWSSGTGPTGSVFAVIPMTDTLEVENLDTSNIAIDLIFQMTVPVGADATDFYVEIDGSPLVFVLVGAVYEATYNVGGVTGGQTKYYIFEWGFSLSSELGTYSLGIVADSY